MIDIFIPSYHRPRNLKTVKFFTRIGYDADKIHVVIDSEADDVLDYERTAKRFGIHLHTFDMAEARSRYDYVHRPSPSRRSAGQARNMFYDIADALGISFYMVMDDDTTNFQNMPYGKYSRMSTLSEIVDTFEGVRWFMNKHRIGCFGLSQSGDMFAKWDHRILRWKVMNTTFIDTRYMNRGEKGIQDDDTSQFCGIYNEGYFAGSFASGLILQQSPSAKQAGGLTDLYNECKLLNKALVVPIQYPSAVHAERQTMNRGRLHHRIKKRYLAPVILKGVRSNIAWDTYPEDVPFTNEPKR